MAEVRVLQDERLREVHFGDWEMMRWPEIEAAHPEDYWDYMNTWRSAAPPGGESWHQLCARVGEWWRSRPRWVGHAR